MDFKGGENRARRERYTAAVLRVSCLRCGWFHGGDAGFGSLERGVPLSDGFADFSLGRSPVERCFADLFGGSGGWMG